MEASAVKQPVLLLMEANIVLMCPPEIYTTAVNHLQNHCLQYNKEVIVNFDAERSSDKQYRGQNISLSAQQSQDQNSTDASVEVVFPNQYVDNNHGGVGGLYNGTVNFIQGPIDPTLPRAKRTSYWEGLITKHHNIDGICLVIPPRIGEPHFSKRVRDWIHWCDTFYQEILVELFSHKTDLYIIYLSQFATYNSKFSFESWLERDIRQFHLGNQQETIRFLKTVTVDMPLKQGSRGGSHSEFSQRSMEDLESTGEDASSICDPDQDEANLSTSRTTRLSKLHKVLVIAAFEMRGLLHKEYSGTMKQCRATEDSIHKLESEIKRLRLSLLEKEHERDYLTVPNMLEIMKDVSQNYRGNFEFDIKTNFNIIKFDLEPLEVLGKWDPIHPPTIDPGDPKRFIGKLTELEDLPLKGSRFRKDVSIRDSHIDLFILRLFGYRHEIHEKEIHTLKNEIRRINRELQYATALLEELTEQHAKLCSANEKQQELLSVCQEDIQVLYRTDQLDWNFDKLRHYLSESCIREISSEYGLKGQIPKAIARSSLQISEIERIGIDIFKTLSGKLGEQLVHNMGTFVPTVNGYENTIGKSFRSMMVSRSRYYISMSLSIFGQENNRGEEDEEEDEWLKTRSSLRSQSQEYSYPNSNSYLISIEGTKKHEEYTNLLGKALDVGKNLEGRLNSSLELSKGLSDHFIRGVVKFRRNKLESLRRVDIRELLSLDTEAFKNGKSPLGDGFLEIGIYANILHHTPALQAISAFYKNVSFIPENCC
ncbi:hypothetical protein TWF506_009973 [Arthrobotrys conoides]|uniref:Uncharacterized protein n=1 Tax=Arthrobotrys conoides TaxID=74498 RepID=A0AAN8RQP0_9PEZI